MENKNKEFYLMVNGQKVIVSEAVYRAYIQPVRAERRRKQRAFRCKVRGKNGKLVRCQKDCRECPYALSGHNALGNNLSLDRMKDEGVEVEDCNLDVEQSYIEKEEKQELHAAIKQLNPRQQQIVQLIYFEGKSQEEVRKLLGIAKSSMGEAMQRIHDSLKRFLEKN